MKKRVSVVFSNAEVEAILIKAVREVLAIPVGEVRVVRAAQGWVVYGPELSETRVPRSKKPPEGAK